LETIHISRELALLIRDYGSDKVVKIIHDYQKRCKWQRERYHRVLKPIYKAKREAALKAKTHRSSKGPKLYPLKDSKGRFKDIVEYKKTKAGKK
jgi:hypothetical protein